MLVGYARTSTLDQVAGLDAQVRDLKNIGCEKLFIEQVSSVARRDELNAAMEFVREGDTLVCTRIDRLARSTTDLLALVASLEKKGVALRVNDFGGSQCDTTSASGRMILTVMAAIGQFELQLLHERMREGIAKAKADGKYLGRAPTALRKSEAVLAAKAEGLGASAIAARCSISRASVYRILHDDPRT
ncbi:MAG: tnpR [Sphingomonadales bacterium]|nr:tnpR [Sphingomonadales bacterium]